MNSTGPEPHAAPAEVGRALRVWYDGDCPICTAEIGVMRRLDRDSVIDFVDLSQDNAAPADRAARLARMHVQTRGGDVVSGAAAFVEMWRVLPALRPLATIAALPPMLWILERAYRGFLKIRPALQRVALRGQATRARTSP